MNVTIYCRISLDRTGEMLGVDRQESECRAYCERQGWTVREVLVDNDISATSGKVRPAFEKLLASNPEAVVVWHTDRLVRLSRELERVIDLGVNVHAIHAGHLDLSHPAGRATAKTITAWAQYEGEQKSIRQKSSHRQRAASGRAWWTARPFGFNMDGTLCQPEAEAVRTGYGDVIDGRVTLTGLARRWDAAGLLTTRPVKDADGNVIRSGGSWSQASVRQLLVNPRNAGIRAQHGVEIGPGLWDRIVSVETFRAAVAVLNDPTRRTGGGGVRAGLLVNLAVCGTCDTPVRLSTNGYSVDGQRKVWRKVYACPKGCATHPVSDLDEYVGEIAVATLRDPRFASALDGADDRAELLAERAALVVAMRELGQDRAMGLVPTAEFRPLRAEQNERLSKLDETIRVTMERTALAGLPSLDAIADAWHAGTLPDADKRQVVAAFFRVSLMPRRRGERVYDPERSARVVPASAEQTA